jgi:hypothetical protein
MGVRAALVIGLFVTLASFLHGGIYAPGQDFIVNRFTPRRSGARLPRFVAARGACDPTSIGR